MQCLFVILCFTCKFSYLKHLPRIRQINITCPILNNEMYYKHGKGNIISTVWSPLQSDSVKNKSTIYVKFEKIWTPSDTCAWYMIWREKPACAPQPQSISYGFCSIRSCWTGVSKNRHQEYHKIHLKRFNDFTRSITDRQCSVVISLGKTV